MKINKSPATHLEIDSEGRDLLRQTQKIDGSVQEIRLELGLEINNASAGDPHQHSERKGGRLNNSLFVSTSKLRDVDKRYDVQGELYEYGQQHVEVEDVPEWSFS